jgi:hypothetical protein
MTNNYDPLSDNQLARRLHSLQINVPPFGREGRLRAQGDVARRQVQHTGWTRLGRPGGLLLGAALAGMLLVTAAAYPDTIATLTQGALNAAGLSSGQLSSLHGEGEQAGARAVVNGGYGDDISTVLFIAFDLPCKVGPCGTTFPSTTYGGQRPIHEGLLAPDPASQPYLADQYGERYTGTIGGIGVGAYPSFFEPIRGRAGSGARLTLHVPLATRAGRTELVAPISGTLAPRRGTDLNVGPAVTRGGVTYEVAQVAYSGSYLEVHTRLTGQIQSIVTQYPDGGQGYAGVFLVDQAGRWSIPVSGIGFATINNTLQDETRIFAASKGTYRIVVAASKDNNATPGGPGWATLAEWTVRTT